MDKYVIITPAYNEEDHLERLCVSIERQSIQPTRWIIVNDGSSDKSEKLINQFARHHHFIQVLSLERSHTLSYYARKVLAFNAGYKLLLSSGCKYDLISNLDADISLPHRYYEVLLENFGSNKKLGIAGGLYKYPDDNIKVYWGGNYVPGSALVARRTCFEQIGGYRPLKYGAEDTLLCVMAEENGWEVQCFPELLTIQHRIVGVASSKSIYKIRFRQGLSEATIGYHPLFSFMRFVKRAIVEKPYFFGSLARYSGFVAGLFSVRDGYVSKDTKNYLRNKQMKRITHLFKTNKY